MSDGRTEDGTVAFSGRVVGLEGEAIAGLSLAIQHVMFADYADEVEWIQPLETETDEDGAFSFSGITPGQVQLILPFDIETEKQFYVEPENEILSIKIGEVTYHQQAPYTFGGITFTITPGVHIQNVEVTVRPRMRIRGRIVFNDGSPLADARIRTAVRQEDLDGSGSGSSSGGTQTDHPLGWLLRVLQQERADEAAIRRVLIEALSHPDALSAQEASQRREAIAYLVALVLHRRPAEEHQGLINLIDQYTHDMEVAPMAETMAEILLERGIEQGIEQGARENAIKNILTVLAVRFSERDAEIAKHRLESILDLDRLTQLHRTAVNTPSFQAFLRSLDP